MVTLQLLPNAKEYAPFVNQAIAIANVLLARRNHLPNPSVLMHRKECGERG